MSQGKDTHRTRNWTALSLLSLRVILTFMTLTSAIWAEVLTVREMPFHVEIKSTYFIIMPRAGVTMLSGIVAGDHVNFAAQSAVVRAVLLVPNVPGHVAYPIVVDHRGTRTTVMVHSVTEPDNGWFLNSVSNFTLLTILVVGLATLWRGRNWSAWGLSMFALSVIIGNAVFHTTLPPFGNVVVTIFDTFFTGPLPLLGLFITARSLIDDRGAHQGRGIVLYLGLMTVMLGCEIAPYPMILWIAHDYAELVLNMLGGGIAIVLLLVPVFVLANGYTAALAEQKLRIKWVLAGTAPLIPLLLLEFLGSSDIFTGPGAVALISAGRAVLGGLVFGLYAFAVLSTRLIDVRVVINRAVVFTALMGLVVGILALVENLIENSALHGRAGLALEVAAPLILGIAFDQLQRRIEQVVDRVFFRREHKARERLRDFMRDAGFIEQADVLVARTVAVFDHHAGGHGAVLYEARSTLFERTAQHGGHWPEAVDGDDPALVRLRATLAPLDLHGIESKLGADGLILPLALRGRMFGVLVCGPRSAGRYAQTEMAELGQAAREVGASLFALRARSNEALVERLALGQVAPHEATIEARQLSGLAT